MSLDFEQVVICNFIEFFASVILKMVRFFTCSSMAIFVVPNAGLFRAVAVCDATKVQLCGNAGNKILKQKLYCTWQIKKFLT